jgi:predicted permease
VDSGADFWTSMDFVRATAGDPSKPVRARAILGRLNPGVTIAQAGAALSAIWPSVIPSTLPGGLAVSERDDLQRARIDVQPISTGFSRLRQKYADPLQALTFLTVLLFLLGCANLSGVLLARLLGRDREIATQLALGATRATIDRQTAVETLLLACMGAVCAAWIAFKGSAAIGAFLWNGASETLAVSLVPDGALLVSALAVVLACGLVIGIVPTRLVTRRMDRLHAAASQRTGRTGSRTGRLLVAGQVAFSLVLLASAGLFVRTLQNLRPNDSAFPASHIVLSRMWLKPGVPRTVTLDVAYYRGLADRLSAVPGVQAASFSTTFPSTLEIQVPQDSIRRTDMLEAPISGGVDYVSPRFFDTLGIEQIAGRDFTWHDDAASPPMVIINSVLAHRLFPDGGAIGRHIRIGHDASAAACEIVGIVAGAPVFGIRVLHVPVAFRPMLQNPRGAIVPTAIVRATGGTDSVIAGYTSVLGSAPFHFLRGVETLESLVDRSLQQERLAAWGASLFAALAIVLAVIGIYGLIAYTTAKRTHEIGVRMALGAGRGSIVSMVIGQGLAPTACGVGVGIVGALTAGTWTRSLLYGVTPYDILSVGGAAALLFVIAIAAGAIPAYRASTIQPVRALRHE